MNTILTRLSAELIEQYTPRASGGATRSIRWCAARRAHAGVVRGARPRSAASPIASLLDAADALAADLAAAACGRASASASGCRAGSRAWWRCSPARKSGAICCPSLHRDHTVGEVVELMQRTRGVAFIWQNGYGADADKRDLIDALKAVPTLRHVYRLEPLAGARHGAVRRHRRRGQARRAVKRPIPTRSSIWPSPPARPASRRA